MSTIQKLTFAQKTRLDYQALRLASRKLTADAPQLHRDNPLLPDTDDDDSNQLHVRHQGKPLKVQVPRPPEAGDPSGIPVEVQLTWDATPVGRMFVGITPLDSSLLFIDLEVPGVYTEVQGKHELSYILVQGGNPAVVPSLNINIDRTPPILINPAIIPPEIEANGITKKYLEDNGFVAVTVPPYGGARIGDHVTVYYGLNLPTATMIAEWIRPDTTTPLIGELTAAIVGTEEGEHAVFYLVEDRKGNPSGFPPFKRFNVVLTDPPEGLVPLDIPLYVDGLIDLEDAQMPVGVGLLAEYTNFLDGDEIVVTWDGQLLGQQKIPGFPFYVNVDFRTVLRGNPGPKTVAVSYQIKRGINLYPRTPLSQNVDVDLRKPGGPIDPDNPGPPNPNLTKVTVQGASGNPANVLTIDDAVDTVEVSVVVYDGAKNNDEVQLRWKGVPVSDADGGVHIVVGTPVPPDTITFDVAWSVIEAGGNGNPIEVDYVITHPDINENADIAPPQDVDVFITNVVLPEVKFLHLYPAPEDFLNCGSRRLDPVLGVVLEVLVAGGEPRLADQELTFTYQGYSDSSGTEAPGTFLEVKYTPTAQEAAAGFVVKIPYEPFRVTLNGWGRISYSAMIDGRPTPSDYHQVRVYMVDSGGGGSCPTDPTD